MPCQPNAAAARRRVYLSMRLDYFIANATTLSRRDAKKTISSGRIRVDGQICRKSASPVAEDTRVSLDDQPLSLPGERYLMLHKPAGVISATTDSQQPTALDLLPDSQRGATAKRVFGIKEAAYKAQFPLTGAVIGFQALEVMPDPAPQTGIAHLRATQIGSMVPGLEVLFPKTGRICRTDGPTPATRDLRIAAISLPR